MQFLAQELGLINQAVLTTPDDKARTFAGTELVTSTDIFRKMRNCVDKEKNIFIDSDVDFTTEEKALILKVADRAWSPAQGDIYLPLKTKLNA